MRPGAARAPPPPPRWSAETGQSAGPGPSPPRRSEAERSASASSPAEKSRRETPRPPAGTPRRSGHGRTGRRRPDCPSTARSPSRGRNRAVASFLRKIIMKRTASRPTSSTTSRNVTKSPERFDIFTGSPPRRSFTSWQSLTSRSPLPSGDRLHGRLHALDVAAVIGAPHVDHRGEAALEFRAVIGDVGGEIGVASRPTSGAAGRRRRRTRSRGRASARGPPNPRPLALRAAAGGPHRRGRGARSSSMVSRDLAPTVPGCSERSEKNTSWWMFERGEVVADHRHHGVDGGARARSAAIRLPACRAGSRHARAASALADRLQIVAGIEPLRDRADRPRPAPRGSAGRPSARGRRPGRRRR